MKRPEAAEGKLGVVSLAAIGIGGMVGGGIFAVLGLSVQLARGGAPLAFLLAGVVALLTAYAYVRLTVALPSRGGTVTFINAAFGSGLLSGTLNVLLWISYIVMLALYASAFGSYGASFFSAANESLARHVMLSGAVVAITLLNMLRADLIGRAESLIVALKLVILLVFVATGLGQLRSSALGPDAWASPASLIAGGMIVFLAFEGFELIANAAEDTRSPTRDMPRAFYGAVAFVVVLYVLVAVVTVGSLPVAKIVAARDYALAEAARPAMGQAGFTLIAVAALLSTASAINATLYGAARLSFAIAKSGELPQALERNVWHKPLEGLVVTSITTLVVANLFDLSSIALMGSAGFLLIFAMVNLANVRLSTRTRSRAWISWLGAFACSGALAVLVWHVLTTDPIKAVTLAAMLGVSFAVEYGYRARRGHGIRVHTRSGENP
jgi:amino acid transporter